MCCQHPVVVRHKAFGDTFLFAYILPCVKDNIGCFFSPTHFLSLITYPCFSCRSPDEVTAEDEAQDEDKDACPEDDHVDIEGQVLEGDGRHGARLVGVNQSKTTEAP